MSVKRHDSRKPRPATIVRRFLAGATFGELITAYYPHVTVRDIETAIRNALNRKRSKRA